MNRAANSLKIAGYTLVLTIVLCFSVSDEEEAFSIGLGVGFVGNIVMMAEQFIAVGNAKKSQPVEKETLA